MQAICGLERDGQQMLYSEFREVFGPANNAVGPFYTNVSLENDVGGLFIGVVGLSVTILVEWLH